MFYAIDGDDVGRRLERFLLENDTDAAAAFSASLTADLERLRQFMVGNAARIIFAAGDSLLAETQGPIDLSSLLQGMSGVTFSVGIGDSPASALLALKMAKGLGRNRIERLLG